MNKLARGLPIRRCATQLADSLFAPVWQRIGGGVTRRSILYPSSWGTSKVTSSERNPRVRTAP